MPEIQDLSLFQLESELSGLVELRESTQSPEELAAVDAQIQEYCRREIAKVDAIRAFLRYCDVMANAAEQEAKIQAARSKAWANRRDRLESTVLWVMLDTIEAAKARGAGEKELQRLKKLEGRTGSFTVRNNGGLQPLKITNEETIPPQYMDVTVTLPMVQWSKLRRAVPELEMLVPVAHRSVNNAALRMALNEPCLTCTGTHQLTEDEACPDCDDGRQRIYGARLEPRGVTLSVK